MSSSSEDDKTPLFAGYLTKLKKGIRRSRKRWFVLTAKELAYYNAQGADNIASFRVEDIKSLKLGTTENPERGLQFEVNVVNFAKGKCKVGVKHELVAETEKEEDHWFAHISSLLLGSLTCDTTSLCYMAEKFHSQGKLNKAFSYYNEAKNILAKKGKKKSDYGKILNNLAVLAHHAGKITDAEEMAGEARDILKSVHGQDHTDHARSLNILATLLEAQGKLKDAEPHYLTALAIWDKLKATKHVDYVTCMTNLGGLYQRLGEYVKAEPLLKNALAIRRAQLGEDHPDFSQSLNSLANFYWVTGDYKSAEPLYLKSLEFRRRHFGEQHRSYASSLHNVAGLYLANKDFEKAEKYYLQARSILEKELGPSHPDYATSLNNLGWTYQAMGQLKEAENMFLTALKIRKKSLGKKHPDFLASVNNLGNLYKLIPGKQHKTIKYFSLEISILKGRFGEDHADVAAAQNNLANVLKNMGDYFKAEPLYLSAVKILYSGLETGKSKLTAYSSCVNNLANLYTIMGDYQRAEPLFIQACEVMKNRVGEKHSAFAAAINNLANLYKKSGQGERSESLYKQACAILRNELGNDHPHYLTSVNNLALCYDETLGDYAAAEQLYLQVIQSLRKQTPLGSTFAGHLRNLANMYVLSNRVDRAEALYEEALGVLTDQGGENTAEFGSCLNSIAWVKHLSEKLVPAEEFYLRSQGVLRDTVGETNPVYTSSLVNLAYLRFQLGRLDDAVGLMEKAAGLIRDLTANFSVCTERQRLGLLTTLNRALPVSCTLALHTAGTPSHKPAVQASFLATICLKQLSLEALAVPRDALIQRLYPGEAAELEKLFCAGRQLTQKLLGGNDDNSLAALQLEHRRMLADLAEKVPEIRVQNALQEISVKSIAAVLPLGAILAEYVRVETASAGTGEAKYVCLVLTGGSEEVSIFELGSATEVDSAVENYISALAKDKLAKKDPGSELEASYFVSDSGEKIRGEVWKHGQHLSALVLSPLLRRSAGASRLLLCPDGSLAKLSFASLPFEGTQFVLDEFTVSQLSSARDLLRFSVRSEIAAAPSHSPPVVISAPNFNLRVDGEEHAPMGIATQLSNARIKFKISAEHTASVAEIFGVVTQKYEGDAANWENFRQIISPQLLHISSAAFAVQAPPRKNIGSRREDSASVAASLGSQSALMRAGIALSGANTEISGGNISDENTMGGLLTATQITGLDLEETRLVVLQLTHENVIDPDALYSLRRAFMLAGTSSILSTTWDVSPEGSAIFMSEFYGRLVEGDGRAVALRKAQMIMRERGFDISDWGAYVLEGDVGPVSLTNNSLVKTEGVDLISFDDSDFIGSPVTISAASAAARNSTSRSSIMEDLCELDFTSTGSAHQNSHTSVTGDGEVSEDNFQGRSEFGEWKQGGIGYVPTTAAGSSARGHRMSVSMQQGFGGFNPSAFSFASGGNFNQNFGLSAGAPTYAPAGFVQPTLIFPPNPPPPAEDFSTPEYNQYDMPLLGVMTGNNFTAVGSFDTSGPLSFPPGPPPTDIHTFISLLSLKNPAGAIQAFEKEGVDVDVISTLSDTDLAAMGINLGDRRRILMAANPNSMSGQPRLSIVESNIDSEVPPPPPPSVDAPPPPPPPEDE